MLEIDVPVKGTALVVDTASLSDVTLAFSITSPGANGPVTIDFPADSERTPSDVRSRIVELAPHAVDVGSAVVAIGARISHTVTSGVRYVDFDLASTLRARQNTPMLLASIGSAIVGRALPW